MAKFKKLALLCTALMMTASAAAIASCGESDRPDSSSQQQSSASSSVEESSEDVVSSEDGSSEDEPESSEDSSSEDVVSSEDSSSEDEPESSEDSSSEEEPESSDEPVSSEDEPESSDEPVSSEDEPESSDEPVSSEEEPESSEDSSSEEPDVPPVVEGYYVNILNEVPGSLALSGNFADDFGTITFNAPSAGTYAIYAVSDLTDYYESEVQFGPVGATDTMNEYFTRYTFTVDAAGEVTVATYGCSWESEPSTLNFYYFVYKLNSATIEGETGVVEGLAANVRNEIKFNAPAAGTYLITSNKECNWYGSLTSLQDAEDTSVGTAYSITVEQAGEVSIYVEYVDFNEEEFNFSYEIVAIPTPNLVLGENTVTLYNDVTMNVTFTAENAGSYVFTINAGDLYVVFTGEIWSETAIQAAEAGQKISLPVLYSVWDGDATVDVTITVEELVEADPSALQLGANIFTASEEGTTITFTAAEEGWYKISEDNGELYEAGDEYGYYTKEVYLTAGQAVSYVVKYAGTVTVTVESFVPPIVLNVGETTINVAGAGCNIQIADPVADGTYTLAWDNANVLVYINGAPFTSGSEFDYVWFNYNIYAETADGVDAAEVVFTLTNIGGGETPDVPTTSQFVLGANAVNVTDIWNGVIMSYTSETGGSFVLKAADGETNGWVDTMTYNANFGDFMRDYLVIADDAFVSYEFTLEAGATIIFWVSTWDENADTINLILETAGTQPEEPEVVTVQFSAGMPTYVEIPANGQTIMEGYIVGKYKVEWDPSVTNLVVYYGRQLVANGDVIEVASPRVPTQLILSTSDGAPLATRVMVSEYVAPAIQAVLGDNAIEVVDTYAGKKVNFTAPEAATYIISAADGETNAIVLVEGMYGADMVNLPYTVTLAQGEVFAFIVATANYEADTINLVIAKEAVEPEVPVLPDDTNREKVAISLTVGQMTDSGETNEYGKVYNLKQGQWFIDNAQDANNLKTMADFQPNALANALVEGGEWIIFYLYNPTATEYQFHLAGGNNGWTDSQHFITLTPNAWTKVVITAEEIAMNKEAAWYMYILGGNNEGAAQAGWKMSTVYAVMEEGWVRSNVLVDVETQTLTQGCYGGAIAVEKAVDDLAGNVWNVTVGEFAEQAFHHDAIDTSYYASVYFYVYNPLATEARLTIHGGWNDWAVATVMLTAKNWTKVELPMSVFTSDVAGKIFPVIQEPNAGSLAGVWKISSFYGLEAGETAPEIKIPNTVYTINTLGATNSSTADVVYAYPLEGDTLGVNSWDYMFQATDGASIALNGEALTAWVIKQPGTDLYIELGKAAVNGDALTINGTFVNNVALAEIVFNDCVLYFDGTAWSQNKPDAPYTTHELGVMTLTINSQNGNAKNSQLYLNQKSGAELPYPDANWNTVFVYSSGDGLKVNGNSVDILEMKSTDLGLWLSFAGVNTGDVVTLSGTFACASEHAEYVIAESKFQWNGSAWENYVEYTTYNVGKVAIDSGDASGVYLKRADGEAFAITDGTWAEKLTFEEGTGVGAKLNDATLTDIAIPGTIYVGVGAAESDVLAIGGTFYNVNLAVKYVIEESKFEFNGEAWVEYIPYYTVKEANAAADDTQVRIANATVCAVNGAWNTDYNNMNVTVTDASGETLYVYRLATEVALGDIITLTGTMATYNEARQIAQGATAVITGHDSSYDYEEMTILEALAAADDTNVIVTGTVVTIDTAWSTQYKNMSVTISDGESNTLYLYRLATQVGLGDVITVKGCMATYNGARQIAAGATAEIIEEHTCSDYTEATCKAPASCIVCGEAKDDVLGNHNYVNGTCSVCGAQEGVSTVTASKTIAELITSEGWTSSTTKQQFKLDDVVTVKVDGGSNTGKAYDGDHIRIYATDSPAGTLTISVADGYELVSIKVTTKTGTYAFLYVDGTTTDICNQSVAVSGSSVKLNSVKNGSNGKQVRVTAIEVVYAVPAPEAPAEPEADPVTINLDVANNLTIGEGTYLTGSVVLNGEYTFAWTNSDNATVTIKVDGVAIDNGYKANYENKTVEIIIESSDNTVDVNVSLTVTKTPEVVVPDEEWTKNY